MHENDGNDIVQGDAGNDDLFGEEGADSMTGGPGYDRFFCSPDGDTITDFNTGGSRDRMSGNCILGSVPAPAFITMNSNADSDPVPALPLLLPLPPVNPILFLAQLNYPGIL